MATNPRKRQRKLEQRAAKRKEKKHQLVKQQSVGLGDKLTAANRCPLIHVWVSEDVWSQGLGWVLLSRRLPNGSIAVAVFLLDRYCLGIKNAIAEIVPPSVYE